MYQKFIQLKRYKLILCSLTETVCTRFPWRNIFQTENAKIFVDFLPMYNPFDKPMIPIPRAPLNATNKTDIPHPKDKLSFLLALERRHGHSNSLCLAMANTNIYTLEIHTVCSFECVSMKTNLGRSILIWEDLNIM